ncbi:MAG: GGDEF domain-containing protein [Bradymonadaceae bacterium]
MPEVDPSGTFPAYEDDEGAGEGPSSSIKRAAQGVALAAGAPLGWIAIRYVAGHPPGAELWEFPSLYTYLFVSTAIVFAAFGWFVGWQEDKLVRKNRALARRAVTDRLTGLRNSDYFWERLREAVARARRDGAKLSLLMIDLDEFKSVNDRFGHRVGAVVPVGR